MINNENLNKAVEEFVDRVIEERPRRLITNCVEAIYLTKGIRTRNITLVVQKS